MSDEQRQSAWEKLVDWIIERLPAIMAAFGVGYKIGNRKVQELETDVLKLELELEKKKNEDTIRKDTAGKSDADLVRDSIRDGRDSR